MVSESHHKKLKTLAAKRGVQLKEAAAEVIEAGLLYEQVRQSKKEAAK